MQLMRAGKSGEAFLKGGFKAKMDKSEAMQILGLRWVVLLHLWSTGHVLVHRSCPS